MTALERLLAAVLLLLALAGGGWLGVRHYGAEQFAAGHAAAVAEGEQARHDAETAHLAIESGLRTRQHDQDIAHFVKEQEYHANLEDAQRRVRAGTDSLRCPASALQPAQAAADRPAAGGPPADEPGPAIVPEAAAEILGDAAAVASLVRRYDRVVERFEACRAVNAKP